MVTPSVQTDGLKNTLTSTLTPLCTHSHSPSSYHLIVTNDSGSWTYVALTANQAVGQVLLPLGFMISHSLEEGPIIPICEDGQPRLRR